MPKQKAKCKESLKREKKIKLLFNKNHVLVFWRIIHLASLFDRFFSLAPVEFFVCS